MADFEAQATTDRQSMNDAKGVADQSVARPSGRRGVSTRALVAIVLAMVVAAAAVVLWPRDFSVRQTATEVFHLDLPFGDVQKILVLAEATDDIMELGDTGDLKEYTWVERPSVFQLVSALGPELDLLARATMKVQTNNEEYVGSHLITLNQDVRIRHESLDSEILLAEGKDRLHDYVNTTRFTPDGKRTKVETSVTLEILVSAPRVARSYAAGRVHANAKRKVDSQVEAIRQVIDANRDKSLLSLPFGG